MAWWPSKWPRWCAFGCVSSDAEWLLARTSYEDKISRALGGIGARCVSSQHGARQKGAMRCWRLRRPWWLAWGSFSFLRGWLIFQCKRRNSKWKVERASCAKGWKWNLTAESRHGSDKWKRRKTGKRGNRDGLTRDWVKILSCKHIERALLVADWLLKLRNA